MFTFTFPRMQITCWGVYRAGHCRTRSNLRKILQADCSFMDWGNFGWRSPHFPPRLCVFGWVHAIHSSWTVPMSHYGCNKWWDKVEVGLHCLQWILQADLIFMDWGIFCLQSPRFVVMALTGFCGDWAAIWRLRAMVMVVEVSIFWVENGEKKVKSHKKSSPLSAPMVFRTTTGESSALELNSSSDDHQTALIFDFKMLFSLCSNYYFRYNELYYWKNYRAKRAHTWALTWIPINHNQFAFTPVVQTTFSFLTLRFLLEFRVWKANCCWNYCLLRVNGKCKLVYYIRHKL